LRQTGGGNVPVWTSWHPLGDACSAIAGGAGTSGVPELWFVDTGLTTGAPSLNMLTQNPVSLNWTTQPVVKPKQATDTPQATASYVTQIALINQDTTPSGVPVPGAPVTISTVEPVVVTVEGQQYTIAPNQPQTFGTDEFGRITLSTPALGLHTAALTIAATNAASALVYPAALAHATLQNTTDLATAQYTSTTVPTLVQANLVQSNASNAPDVLSTTKNVFTIQQTNNITPNDTGPDQNFTPVSSYEAARAFSAAKFVSSRPLRGPSHDPENLTLLGDFWDDLFHFAEDVFHAIATGVLEVISVASDVANGVIELSIQLANGAAQAVQYLVHTIDDVAHAIESAFQWLAAKVEMVINWLKELFSWGDIVNTGKVLAHYIQQLLSAGSAYLTPAGSSPLQQLIDGQLVALTQQITAALTSLAGDSRSISDLAPSPSSLQPPAGVVSANSGNQARTNYAQRHTQNYLQNGGVIAAGAASSAALGNYTAQVNSTSQSQAVSSATAGFQGGLGNVFSDPSAFFGTLLSDLVGLVNDLIVAVMDVARICSCRSRPRPWPRCRACSRPPSISRS
jgi:hypothetical protein